MTTFRSGRLRQQLLQVAEQEIDVQAALVRLVDDDACRRRAARGSPCVSASRMPSVISLIAVRGPTLVVEAHLVADRVAELDLSSSSAMRAATARAAMRRGCVWPMQPALRRARISSRILGSCVVLPEPVSPQTMTTGCALDRARDLVAPRVDRQRGVEVHCSAWDEGDAVIRQRDRHLGAGRNRARHVAVDDEQLSDGCLDRVFHVRAEIGGFPHRAAQRRRNRPSAARIDSGRIATRTGPGPGAAVLELELQAAEAHRRAACRGARRARPRPGWRRR